MLEFREWPKIARLNRDIIITEKIDGTNAAVVIDEDGNIGAQSRSRLITPEKDNFGFAAWVQENREDLLKILGPGHHFGEWWGSGIQRGYGMPAGAREFSLFNTKRWDPEYDAATWPDGLNIVPILFQGNYSKSIINLTLANLKVHGSFASPFMNPEGIVVYHTAGNVMFKVTLEEDGWPKTDANSMRTKSAA